MNFDLRNKTWDKKNLESKMRALTKKGDTREMYPLVPCSNPRDPTSRNTGQLFWFLPISENNNVEKVGTWIYGGRMWDERLQIWFSSQRRNHTRDYKWRKRSSQQNLQEYHFIVFEKTEYELQIIFARALEVNSGF